MARRSPTTAAALRAEAMTLAIAGAILLGLGFPVTLLLAALAFTNETVPPLMPLLIGAPIMLAGYGACHFASAQLLKAKALELRH